MNGPKIYFTIPILGGIPITSTTVSSFVVMLIICTAAFILGRNPQKRPGTRQALAEKFVEWMYSLVEDTMGKHNSYWTPYIAALFLSSILGTYIGMTGFLRAATSDLSTTVTWALMTSVLCWACSIRENGFLGWLKGFADPVPVMLPMNIVSEIAQPVSMAFRHFGNIMGGGVLMSLLYSALSTTSAAVIGLIKGSSLAVEIAVIAVGAALLAYGFVKNKLVGKIFGVLLGLLGLAALLETLGVMTGMPVLALGIPGVLSIYFDIFSGLVQALVFSLLTMVYVGNACPPHETENNINKQ
ncbi:MAG: F0F1 ATP synthase subunit A [Oscillospiraceae bacterium]|nr:F0F1 ATP synthase subunit A [Oscillospiraceae bacterium]